MFSEEEIKQHNKYMNEGSGLIEPYMFMAGRPEKKLESGAIESIKKGIALLKKAIYINPENWNTYWVMGKGHQALKECEQAYDAFYLAHSFMPDNADVARECMLEAINISKFEKAIAVGEKAISLRPDDSGLKANLAIALLLDGQLDRALGLAETALKSSPSDQITKNILNIIRKVKSGRKPQPRCIKDLR